MFITKVGQVNGKEKLIIENVSQDVLEAMRNNEENIDPQFDSAQEAHEFQIRMAWSDEDTIWIF